MDKENRHTLAGISKISHTLAITAKENPPTRTDISKISHTLAISAKKNRHTLADFSKICHTLAISHGEKPSAPSGKGCTPAAVAHTAEPSGECGKHTAENYANYEANYEALHLTKSSDETGCALLSPVRSATTQNTLQNTRKLQSSLQSDSVLNGNSEAQTSYSDKQLRLSAVIDEGKGAVALTEVTSATNIIALSSHIAVSPVIKMLDKADCDKFTVSPSLSSVLVRKEGEGEQSLKELDFTTTARPVALTNFALLLVYCSML
jgi:hypothetical protein